MSVINSIPTPSFFFAGKATFTVSNIEADVHHTFRIKASKDGNVFFVSKLTGSESYSFMGTIFDKYNPVIKAGKKSKLPAGHKAFAIAEWSLNKVIDNNVPATHAIQHDGRCGRCGRVLTDPQSINRGIGPTCAEAMGMSIERIKPSQDDNDAERDLAQAQQ